MTRKVDRSIYLLPTAVFGSASLAIVLALSIPYLLVPAQYARFSLALAWIQLLSSIGFEWLRVSVLRHSASTAEDAGEIRANLARLYLGMTAVLGGTGVALIFAALHNSFWWMPAFIFLSAAMQGVFDGRCAWARAHFDNRTLAIAMVGRPLTTLVLVLGACWFVPRVEAALAAFAFSFLISITLFRDSPASVVSGGIRPAWPVVRQLGIFGGSAAVSTNISLALPAAMRSVLITVLGAGAAGGALFALDLVQRVFATIGLSFNLLHFQSLIRVADTEGREAVVAKARRTIALEALLYALLAAGIAATATPFGKIVAPSRFEADFITYLPAMALLMAALCLRQFAIEPLYIVFKQVRFISLGPAITLLAFLLVFGLERSGAIGTGALMALLVLSGAAGFLVPLAFLYRVEPGCVPNGALLAFAGIGVVAYWLTPVFTGQPPLVALLLQGMIVTAIFALLAVPLAVVTGWLGPLRLPLRA